MISQRILFLWRNAETLVIGLSQNPWMECNTRRMEQDGIRLARRHSGGGVVFHGLSIPLWPASRASVKRLSRSEKVAGQQHHPGTLTGSQPGDISTGRQPLAGVRRGHFPGPG